MSFRTYSSRFFLSLIFLILPLAVFSQNTNVPTKNKPEALPKNIIKVAPFAFIHGQVPFGVESKLSYERVIGSRNSLGGSYSHIGSNPVFGFIGSVALSATLTTVLNLYGKPGKAGIVWSETKIKTSGYRYQFQFKHYLSKKTTAPSGLYLSPHYSYSETDYDVTMSNLDLETTLKAKNRNFNLLFGYQEVIGKHFVVEVFTGLGYKRKSTDIYDKDGNWLHTMPKGSPLKVSSGFNLGIAF